MGKATKKTTKRPPSHRRESREAVEEPRTKKLKTEWCDDDRVFYEDLPTFDGIAIAGRFERRQDEKSLNLENIKEEIKTTSGLTSLQKSYIFYRGFKAALQDILTDIMNTTCDIILIHGIPKVGKSSLAHCLAYYLALEGDTAAYVKMANKPDLKSKVVASSLMEYLYRSNWVIYDQCNMNSLNGREDEFVMSAITRREHSQVNRPIIVFTSGDYSPLSTWQNKKLIKIKVINMEVDESVVEVMKQRLGMGQEVNNKDVLKMSKTYGHVQYILFDAWKVEEVNLETMQESVYKLKDMDTLRKREYFFWLLWPEFTELSLEEINSSKDAKIHPTKVQYLRMLLTDTEDPGDINGILNWMNICGEAEAEEQLEKEGYCTYDHDTYYYYFLHLDRLHPLLTAAFKKCTPQKMYDACYELYERVDEIDECGANTLKGLLFKNLIGLAFKLHKKSLGIWITKVPRDQYACICLPADKVDHVEDPEHLCQTAKAMFKNVGPGMAWCNLNASSNRQFTGYDFACISSGPEEKRIQLIAVAINPVNHKKATMNSVLAQVQEECSEAIIVEAFFLVPVGTGKKVASGYNVVEYPLPKP